MYDLMVRPIASRLKVVPRSREEFVLAVSLARFLEAYHDMIVRQFAFQLHQFLLGRAMLFGYFLKLLLSERGLDYLEVGLTYDKRVVTYVY